MAPSPRNEAEKIEYLIEYYKMYKKRGEWSVTLNHRLPLLVSAKKDCIIGLYKAIISIYNKDEKRRKTYSIINELSKQKYGKEKQILKRQTISKYLKGMVEGMMQIISLDYLSSDKIVGSFAYLSGMKDASSEFHYKEMERSLKYNNNNTNDSNIHAYSLMRDMYFHPLYNKRKPIANELMAKTIIEYKINSYIETFKLELQSMELQLIKGVDVSSFPSITQIIADSKASNFFGSLLLKLYASLVDILKNEPKDTASIVAFSEVFPLAISQTDKRTETHKIPAYDAAYLYNLITNALIRLQRKGSIECQIASVRLNDACINTRAVLVNDKIPHEYFFNIIQQRTEVGLSSGSYSLSNMIAFINNHVGLVHKNRQEYSKMLTMKYVHLIYGDADSAYRIGGISEDCSIVDKTLYSCFELACVFCIDSTKEFLKQSLKFEQLLEEGKKENNNNIHVQGYFTLIEKLRELRKLDDKTRKLNSLDKEEMIPFYKTKQQEIKTYPSYLSMKSWLLDIYETRINKKDIP